MVAGIDEEGVGMLGDGWVFGEGPEVLG